ncbi:DUF2190 family protein, partial [Pseudooceanicola sp. CBS1P-1]
GGGVLVGKIFGVAQAPATSGEDVVLVRRGVFEIAKTSAQAWTVGAAIYWDDTNQLCTTEATDTVLIGAATAEASDPSSTGSVLLDGSLRA